MNVGKLKELLKDVDDSLQVRLVTDHGQCAMTMTGYGESYIEEDSYTADEIHEDDLDGYDDPVKVYILEAF